MRNLIKTILKEYYEEAITFVVLENGFKVNLDEAIQSYVPREVRESFKALLQKVNPFEGKFVDKYTGKEVIITYIIEPSDHFINRLYRTRDPKYKMGGPNYDPKIVNPSVSEGINLLFDNADKITEQISIGRIKDGDTVEISSKGTSNYQMIVKFDKQYGKKPVYKLHLTTQIKGVRFFDKKHQYKLGLPTYR